MTVALQDDGGGLCVRPLPEYEPHGSVAAPRRWSSLRPAAGPQLRLVGAASAASPVSPVSPEVSPADLWHVLRRVLEVLDGRRQVGQLRTLLPDAAFEALLTRLRSVTPGARHTLRRLHTCYPTSSAVEVSAVIEVTTVAPSRRRVMAAAARFEKSRETWRCAVLRLL